MKYRKAAALLAGIMLLTSVSGCKPSSKEYEIEGPIEQKEVTYTAGVELDGIIDYLKEVGHNFIMSRHGEGAYIAYDPFYAIELETGIVIMDTVYFPIICDGNITGGVAAFNTENGIVGSAISKSTDFSIINSELAKDPDAQYLFATIGTISVLISPDNRIIPLIENDLKLEKFFDENIDWYSHFSNEYSLISYNELTAEK